MAAHRKPTKKGRKLVVLECSEQRQMVRDGIPGAGGPRGGVSRYYTEKNVRNTPELLKLRKFNKYLGRHTLHVELKWVGAMSSSLTEVAVFGCDCLFPCISY